MGDRLTAEKKTEVKTVERDNFAELLTMPVGGDILPVIPTTLDECFKMADAIIDADMVPLGLEGKTQKETRGKVAICIQKGLEVGFAPVTSLSRISVINGRPCIDCEGGMAKALESKKLEWCKEHFEGEGDDRTAVCSLKRRGVDEPVTRRFSVKDAKRAKLWNHPKRLPWIQYPQVMLPTRARAMALRVLFADVLAGLHIMEEQRDIPAAPCAPDTSFLDDEPAPEATTEPAPETASPEPSSGPVETTDPKWEQTPKPGPPGPAGHPYLVNMDKALQDHTDPLQLAAFWEDESENRAEAIKNEPLLENILESLYLRRLEELE